MISEVLAVLYFFVPAYIANMTPVFFRKIDFLDVPLDFGSKLRGRRLFGKNKTWRGMLSGILFGGLTFWLQILAHEAGFTAWSLIDYSLYPFWLGGLVGFGALLGDAFESMVKRQLDRPPGKAFVPWDQVDFVFGAMLVTVPYWFAHWQAMIIALLVIVLIDMVIQRIGFLLGLKSDPL